MPMRSRTYVAAAFASLLLAVPAAGQVVPDNGTVGAPELRGFRLPGTRVVPAPATDAVVPPAATPPAAERTPGPPAATTSRQNASQAERPVARTATPAPVPVATSPAPLSQDSSTLPEARPSSPVAAPPQADALPEVSVPISPSIAVDQPLDAPDDLSSGGTWWPALAGGLALLLGFFFLQRRRRAAFAVAEPVLARTSVPDAQEPDAPVRRRVFVEPKEEDEALRPAMEIDFAPERMVATALQAAVHFDLTVRNTGNGPARNVRIEARMFNASAQQGQEIGLFLAAPAPIDTAGSVTFQPGQSAQMRSSVVMPKESVREIRIDGRPLFIPTVAIKIVYQWGRGRSDQVHKTYLIGIENQRSPEKMGPFRLDMGPRIYRSVGGRPIELARAS